MYRASHDGNVDVIERPLDDGFEELLAFDAAPVQPEVRYTVTLEHGVAGLRAVGNTVEFLDKEGTPKLRLAPPEIMGSDCERHEATLVVEDCAADADGRGPWGRTVTPPGRESCTIAVRWSDESVRYPAVLDPTWTLTGSMTRAVYDHAAVLLPNGKVFVTGGYSTIGGGLVTDASLYDPTTGTFTATTAVPNARGYHSATLLNDGRVLIVGGSTTATNSRTSTIYNPTTATWTPTVMMAESRTMHRAVLLQSGKVLVTGGFEGSTYRATAEVYDPTTNSWSTAGNMGGGTGRAYHTANLLNDGRVLVVGGRFGSGTYDYTTSARLYNPSLPPASAWGAATTLPGNGRWVHAAVNLPDGTVLLAGGNYGPLYPPQAYRYDPTTNQWSTAGYLTYPRLNHRMRLTPTGSVLLAGGNYGGTTPIMAPGAELFLPGTNGTTYWSTAGSLNTAVSAPELTPLGGTRYLLTGGLHWPSYQVLSRAEIFHLCPNDCDDGDACTTDTCGAAGCVHTPISVDDNNACTVDSCNALSGPVHTPVDPDDANPCTIDSCDPMTGVTHAPVAAGTVCGGTVDVCSGIATCNGAGACIAGTPLPNGTSCSDGNACNGEERCLAGACQLGTPLTDAGVDDHNPCTLDSCDPARGIVNAPDPQCQSDAGAPPLDLTASPGFASSTEFLYTGPNAIQTGVAPGTILPERAAVVRGRVLGADGTTPEAGVTVTVLGHNEFGQTLTRSDGVYDLAVNGGGVITVDIAKSGFLPLQRKAVTKPQGWHVIDDVVLTAPETSADTFTPDAGVAQVVHGSQTPDDEDGDPGRRAIVYFPPGTGFTNFVIDRRRRDARLASSCLERGGRSGLSRGSS